MLDVLKAILLGIVEGITEWLPVSSTGHMIILDEFVKLACSDEFINMFLVVIQLGAILAVVWQFWGKIFPFQFKDKSRSVVKKKTLILWCKVIVACIPAVIVGLLFDELFEKWFYHPIPVALALIVFGVAFIWVEKRNENVQPTTMKLSQITFKTAFIIGLFQVLAAIFPGTSRSGATIIGALLIGVSRYAASEFTFILAIPVMFGASLLKIVKFGLHFSAHEVIVLLVGMIVAFIVSALCIKFLMNYVRKHDFKVFGWYRIALGILIIILGICGVIS